MSLNAHNDLVYSWEGLGDFLSLDYGGSAGLKVFYRDIGDKFAGASRTLVLIHGFPESSYSFHKVIDGLGQYFQRIIAVDLPGYGLSDKPDGEHYSYSLIEQADILLSVLHRLSVRGAHMLAHDMGTSVLTEIAHRDAETLLPKSFDTGVLSYTFTNGSMMLEHAELRLMQKLLLTPLGKWIAKLSNFTTFEKTVLSAHGVAQFDPEGLTDEDIKMLWCFQSRAGGQEKLYLTIRYLNDRKRFQNIRWLPALTRLNDSRPIHICWGEADQVARKAMAVELKNRICVDAKLTLMPGVGHFCQIGSPEQWLDAVLEFYRHL